MRDYYDVYILYVLKHPVVDFDLLRQAFLKTSIRRGSAGLENDVELLLDEIENSDELQAHWKSYQIKFDYSKSIRWMEVMEIVRNLYGALSEIK